MAYLRDFTGSHRFAYGNLVFAYGKQVAQKFAYGTLREKQKKPTLTGKAYGGLRDLGVS